MKKHFKEYKAETIAHLYLTCMIELIISKGDKLQPSQCSSWATNLPSFKFCSAVNMLFMGQRILASRMYEDIWKSRTSSWDRLMKIFSVEMVKNNWVYFHFWIRKLLYGSCISPHMIEMQYRFSLYSHLSWLPETLNYRNCNAFYRIFVFQGL
jgi:hypothetical protein